MEPKRIESPIKHWALIEKDEGGVRAIRSPITQFELIHDTEHEDRTESESRERTGLQPDGGRPKRLPGYTYRVGSSTADKRGRCYVTLNDVVEANNGSRPFEMFVHARSAEEGEWMQGLALAVSALLRDNAEGAQRIGTRLREVAGSAGPIIDEEGITHRSMVGAIGAALETHIGAQSDTSGQRTLALESEMKPTSHDALAESMAHRPKIISGWTYKIQTPKERDAYYLTLNALEMEDASEVPYEMFISTKHLPSYPWITAIATLGSMGLRNRSQRRPCAGASALGGVHDATGGYFRDQGTKDGPMPW